MRGRFNWLADWRLHSLELFIAARSLCSGLTTFLGARNLANESWLVAFLFTTGIQGSMFFVAHRATAAQPNGQGRRLFSLYASWLLLALFSVYSSALGMFELQQGSIKADHDRASLIQEWRAAVAELSDFRAQALTAVRTRTRDTSLQPAFEKNREIAYHRAHREYSPKEKQTLKSRLDALTGAEGKLGALKPPAATPPSDLQQARAALDPAFAEAGDIYASLPEDIRSETRAPRRAFGAIAPEDLQKLFRLEMQTRSGPALFMVLIAFLLDFLPIALRYAGRPRRSLAEVIRYSRRSFAQDRCGSGLCGDRDAAVRDGAGAGWPVRYGARSPEDGRS